MEKRPEWRIYYGDGSTFDSLQGSPESAPPYGVQVIASVHPDYGRVLLRRWDWYYIHDGEWFGSDVHGLLSQLMHDQYKLISAVKQGQVLSTPRYTAIVERARSDPDFPPMSAERIADENRGLRY